MLNKRGALGEQLHIITFLFLLIVAGLGIVAGVFLFFGEGYDFKVTAGEIFVNNLGECFLENAELIVNINNLGSDEEKRNLIYSECELDGKVVEDSFLYSISDLIRFGLDDTICLTQKEKICAGRIIEINGKNYRILAKSIKEIERR